MSYTSKFLLTAPYPGEEFGQMIKGYRPGRRGMVESAAYLLTQRAACVSARRATVYYARAEQDYKKGTTIPEIALAACLTVYVLQQGGCRAVNWCPPL